MHSSQRRIGRAAEGTPLLRVHTGKTCIEGSNPSFSAIWKNNPLLIQGVICFCVLVFMVFASKKDAYQSAMNTCTVVFPGSEAIDHCPSMRSMRVFMLFMPVLRPDNSVSMTLNPTPLSSMLSCKNWWEAWNFNTTCLAWLCLTTLFNASSTTRYRVKHWVEVGCLAHSLEASHCNLMPN